MERGSGGCLDRPSLRGKGEDLLLVVILSRNQAKLADWIRLPYELASEEERQLLVSTQCCELRRKGERILELVMARASDEQWCGWLKIPFEHAVDTGNAWLIEPLRAAGAGLDDAVGLRESTGKESAAAAAAAAAMATAASGRNTPRCSSGSTSDRDACFSSCGRDDPSPSQESPVSTTPPQSCCPSPSLPQPQPSGEFLLSDHINSGGQQPSPSSCSSPGDRSVTSSSSSLGPSSASLSAAVTDDPLCLHNATKARDCGLMRELLAAGVDRDAVDLWDCTALHRAAEQADASAEPVRLLLDAGLNVRARDCEGYSPLHFAAARGAEAALISLLAAGSCLSDRGSNGDGPLHSAARFLSLATVRILLEYEADESAENNEGQTPRDVIGVLPDGRPLENQPHPLVPQGILALLDDAPRRRRWKRRGWIVMLRARAQDKATQELAEAVRTGCLVAVRKEEKATAVAAAGGCEVDLGNCCGEAGGAAGGGGLGKECAGDGGYDGAGDRVAGTEKRSGFAALVDHTTQLAEEGVFQNVVRYL